MGIKQLLDLQNRVFVIAEVGNNHNGSFSTAKELLDKAVETGVDAVKYQTFNTEKWFTDKVPIFARAKTLGYKNQIDRFRDLELSIEQFLELAKLANEAGIVFLTTVLDLDSLEAISQAIPAFKVSSADLIHIQFLEKVSKINKPVILSTGQATVEEIDQAISIFPEEHVALLHCVSSYPTPENQVNLNSINFLRKKYPFPIGYSDHTIGILACEAAVAIGARIIEKHFTLDSNQKFGDHSLSAGPNEMKKLVKNIRSIENMMGSEVKECQPCEVESKKQLRRSLHLRSNVKKGTALTGDLIISLVSGLGIPANKFNATLNKKVVRDMAKGEVLNEDDLK
tara:strand:+ start:609 stop:1628 length:1020 start_codon:yes stop_codon:yes gene_type:complete